MGYSFTSVVINGHEVYGHAFWNNDIEDDVERRYQASLHLVYRAYEVGDIDLDVRNAILNDRSTYVGEEDFVSHFKLPFEIVVVKNANDDDMLIKLVKLYVVKVSGIVQKLGVFSTKEKALAEVDRLAGETKHPVSMVELNLDGGVV